MIYRMGSRFGTLVFLLVGACTSTTRDRSIASEGGYLQLPSRSVKIDGYDLGEESEARATLREILAASEKAHVEDLYQESTEAHVYRVFSEAREVASQTRGHPARKLSDEELTAYIYYSDQGYEDINKALWSKDFGSNPLQVEHTILGLISALNRLPAMAGKFLRGDFVDPKPADATAARARYDSLGEDFVNLGFWSATRAQSVEAKGHFINYAMGTAHKTVCEEKAAFAAIILCLVSPFITGLAHYRTQWRNQEAKS